MTETISYEVCGSTNLHYFEDEDAYLCECWNWVLPKSETNQRVIKIVV